MEKIVTPKAWRRNITSVHAKLLNLEDLSRHAMTISTSQDNISQQISLKPAMLWENIHLFKDMIYSWLVSCKNNKPRDISKELFMLENVPMIDVWLQL